MSGLNRLAAIVLLIAFVFFNFVSTASAQQVPHNATDFYASSNYGQYPWTLPSNRFSTVDAAFKSGWHYPYVWSDCSGGSGYKDVYLSAQIAHWSGYYDGEIWTPVINRFRCNDGALIQSGPNIDDVEEHWSVCNGDYANATRWGPWQCPFPSIDPDKRPGGSTCPNPKAPNCIFGDPIDAATGNDFLIKTEYRGSGPFPLNLTWTYNSLGAGSGWYATDFVLGANRTHNYEIAIHVSAFANGLTSAALARADGKTLYANFSGGNWTLDSDVDGVLQSTQDSSGNFLGFTYLNERGETETYNGTGTLLTITDRNGFTQTITHNANAQVASVTDALGRKLQFAYDTNGRISQVTQPDGGLIAFGYDSNNNLQIVTYPGGKFVQYGYGAAAQTSGAWLPNALTSVTDENASVYSTTSYDAQGRAIGNYLGNNVASYTINYTGGTAITTPLGSVKTATLQPVVGVNRVTQLVETCNGCTSRTSGYSYATNGHVGTETDPNGVVTAYDYNGIGLEKSRIEAQGKTSQRTIQTDWDTRLRLPTERRTYDASGMTLVAKTDWTYNTRGQVRAETQTDPVTLATRTTTTAYCEQADVTAGSCPLIGLVKSVTGPRTDITTDVTTYTYYPTDANFCGTAPAPCAYRMGDLWKVTNALGQVTTFLTYDNAGRPLSKTDANGVETDLQYSPRGWITQRAVRAINGQVSTGDQVTGYAYDNAGQVTRATQPDGSYTAFTYDAAHRLTDIADNLGDTIHYTLDAAGNRTHEDTKDPSSTLKRSVVRTYNALAQLATTVNADGTTTNASYTYDANGNTDHVIDGRGTLTDNDYDELNRLVRTTQDEGDSTRLNVPTKYAYDALDHLTQVTDPQGLNTQYQYDGLGNPTQLTSPDTGITHSTYDAAGDRITQSDARNITASYSYDALNRLAGITYPTSSYNVSFSYDTYGTGDVACPAGDTFPIGRLTHYTDITGSTQFCYDRFGNMAYKHQLNAGAYDVTYKYDKVGRVTQVIEPRGTVINYTRDAAGRITKVTYHLNGQTVDTTVVSNVTYYPFGPVASITYGNGRTLTRSYDKDYVVSAVNDPAAGGLALTFGRDVLGNLTQTKIGATGTTIGNNFVYDALNRLTNVNDLNNTLIAAYSYDGTGNRTSKQVGSDIEQYTYYPGTTHYLINTRTDGSPSTKRTYYANGSTKTIGTNALSFNYDNAGRMSQLLNNGVQAKLYYYDARGERVRKAHSGFTSETQKTVYDEAGHVLGDFDYGNNIIDEMVWMDDLPVGILSGSTPTLAYIEPDHLGTPRAVIDPTRNVAVWTWPILNDAFGESAPNRDPDADGTQFTLNMRMPGQEWDAESGLSYNYYRDYDSGTGRYAESDPLGILIGNSTYSYVRSSPMLHSDSQGLSDDGSPFSYFRCWMAQRSTEADLHCNQRDIPVVYANAVKGLQKDKIVGCEILSTGIRCSATCFVKGFLFDYDEPTRSLIEKHIEVVLKGLKTAAEGWAEHMIAGGAEGGEAIFLIGDSAKAATCFGKCTRW